MNYTRQFASHPAIQLSFCHRKRRARRCRISMTEAEKYHGNSPPCVATLPVAEPVLPVLPSLDGLILSGGGGWIRTTEALASDLQSDPFGRSGTPPELFQTCHHFRGVDYSELRSSPYGSPRYRGAQHAIRVVEPLSLSRQSACGCSGKSG